MTIEEYTEKIRQTTAGNCATIEAVLDVLGMLARAVEMIESRVNDLEVKS